jgi:hypothetical protein
MCDDFETVPLGTTTVMEKVARTLREYESGHRAKSARAAVGTMMQQDHLEKALRNCRLADEVENLLAKKREGM